MDDTGRTRGPETAARLIEAAAQEFNTAGHAATDTNKIARRAGFAPQTFYRWFADKTAIFLAVYAAWQAEEEQLLAPLIAAGASATELARAIVGHHRAHLVFRRSLRALAVENDAVRQGRADGRKRQLERIAALGGMPGSAEAAMLLLQIERLCDATAEQELADLGVPEEQALAGIAALIERLSGGPDGR